MTESNISVRYAKALFQAAVEAGTEARVMEDLSRLKMVLSAPDFGEMLDSPVVKTSGKKKVMDELFGDRFSTLSLNFLHLVLDNKREGYFAAIIRNYTRLYKEKQGIRSAEIMVPNPLDSGHREKFRQLLEKAFNSRIEMEEKVKPELIGGFILKVEDEQYDASVSSGLARIEKTLLKHSTDK